MPVMPPTAIAYFFDHLLTPSLLGSALGLGWQVLWTLRRVRRTLDVLEEGITIRLDVYSWAPKGQHPDIRINGQRVRGQEQFDA